VALEWTIICYIFCIYILFIRTWFVRNLPKYYSSIRLENQKNPWEIAVTISGSPAENRTSTSRIQVYSIAVTLTRSLPPTMSFTSFMAQERSRRNCSWFFKHHEDDLRVQTKDWNITQPSNELVSFCRMMLHYLSHQASSQVTIHDFIFSSALTIHVQYLLTVDTNLMLVRGHMVTLMSVPDY
jgi:hypothetical protein